MTRFTSFVLLVTLAGTPAVAAACAALCLPGALHHAKSATAANHAGHDSARVDGSHEHDATAAQTAEASTDDTWSMSLLANASGHDCCPAADRSVQAREPGPRTDVGTALSLSAAAHTRAASLPAFVSVRRPTDLNPPGTYSARSHAPLVLRI